jgi:hypothetical protein
MRYLVHCGFAALGIAVGCTSSSPSTADGKDPVREVTAHPKMAAEHKTPGVAAPVSLEDLMVVPARLGGDRHGPTDRRLLEVRARGRLDGRARARLGEELTVDARAHCRVGDLVVADVSPIEGDVEADREVRIQGRLFEDGGLASTPSRCELSFRLGGIAGGGVAIDLPGACFHDGSVTPGACDPAIEPHPPTTGDDARVVLDDGQLVFHRQADDPHIDATFRVFVTQVEALGADETAHTKVACADGKRTWAAWRLSIFRERSFPFEAGVSLPIEARLFFNGMTHVPELCEITLELRAPRRGHPFQRDRVGDPLTLCFRGGAVQAGVCGGSIARDTERRPIGQESLVVDDVVLERGESRRFNTVALSFTVEATHALIPEDELEAKVSCKVGGAEFEDTVEADIGELYGSESAAFRLDVFVLDEPPSVPHRCSVELTAGGFRWREVLNVRGV